MTMFDFSCNEEACDLPDWFIPLAFNGKRHNEEIEGSNTDTQTWRMKERVIKRKVYLIQIFEMKT